MTTPPIRPTRAELQLAWRDLRWLLLSPPLLDAGLGAAMDVHPCTVQQFDPAEGDAIEHWLRGLITEPAGRSALAEHLAQAAQRARGASPRLGHRAEMLMAFFLRHGPTHRGVASHIALRAPLSAPLPAPTPAASTALPAVSPMHGKEPAAVPTRSAARTTLGEIDFLVRDQQGWGWHWELAVKFYLCTASGGRAGWADFIGPNRADSLAVKLHKMFGQQLRHVAPAPWDTEPWRPAACVRGRLFYRHGREIPLTPGLNPAHLQGRWIERARLHELAEGDWRCLPPGAWMAPLAANDDGGLPDSDAHTDTDTDTDAEGRRGAMPAAGSAAALGEAIDALWQRQRISGGVAGSGPLRAVMAVRRAHPTCGDDEPAGTELERIFVVPNGWPWTADG